MSGQVFWITGFSGVGKTTIGTRLYYKLKEKYSQIVLLDGDVIKKLFGAENPDYSMEGRKKRAFQYSELCKLLASQGITVICCTIAMFDDVRDWNRKNIQRYFEVFIDVELETAMKRDAKGLYKKFFGGRDAMVGADGSAELPKNPNVIIHNSMDGNIDGYIDEILFKSMESKNQESFYWDGYYKSGHAPTPPSDFARFTMEYVKTGGKLIDLGCGNGRDSVFFCKNGLKVTAVDSSADAISCIDKSLPIFAICDDFVAAKALFCVDYDYCYARWSIHAINKNRQEELLPSVYNALRESGLFFIEARTIHDNKYGKGEQIGPDEYFFDNHYRRFINPDALKEQLERIGFAIVYYEESNRFSVVNEDAPTLIRIVAKKMN